jgi:hypothetical protein
MAQHSKRVLNQLNGYTGHWCPSLGLHGTGPIGWGCKLFDGGMDPIPGLMTGGAQVGGGRVVKMVGSWFTRADGRPARTLGGFW